MSTENVQTASSPVLRTVHVQFDREDEANGYPVSYVNVDVHDIASNSADYWLYRDGRLIMIIPKINVLFIRMLDFPASSS